MIREKKLDQKVIETFEKSCKQTLDQHLSGAAPEVRRKERMDRKAKNNHRRKAAIQKLTAQSLHNSGAKSPCLQKKGAVKALIVSLGTLLERSPGA